METLATIRKSFRDVFYGTNIEYEVIENIVYINFFINGRENLSLMVDKKDKKEAYGLLSIIINRFDFSYFLEFRNIDDLRIYKESTCS